MRKTNWQSIWKGNWRRVLAVAFLFVLMAEWGSHSLAFAHSSGPEGEAAIHAKHGSDDDLCKTLVKCPEGPRQEMPPPNVGHQIVQQNIFSDGLDSLSLQFKFNKDPRFARSRISGLFRAVSPPFHPPEFS